MKLERKVTFTKPFDKRSGNPSTNYGVGSMNVYMYLIGDKGAVQFMWTPAIYPLHVHREWANKVKPYHPEPTGWDVGYHSKTPMYKGQTSMDNDCSMTGGECYYDGSGLRGEEWFKIFIEDGEDKIWEMLEEYYNEVFGQENNND